MAKRKRQDKQTVNQRREVFVLSFSHCIVFSSLIYSLFVLSFSHYIVFSSLIYSLFVLSFSFSHCIVKEEKTMQWLKGKTNKP
jgi:hypothetical protein